MATYCIRPRDKAAMRQRHRPTRPHYSFDM